MKDGAMRNEVCDRPRAKYELSVEQVGGFLEKG